MTVKQAEIQNGTVRRLYSQPDVRLLRMPGVPDIPVFNRLQEISREVNAFINDHPVITIVVKTSWLISVLSVLCFVIWVYNTCCTFRNDCFKYYAQIGVEVKRRDELIPNLIILAEKYSIHERSLMTQVADARKAVSSEKDAGAANKDLEASKLLAVMEQYPELKAVEPVKNLIAELAGTENRMADMKLKYNESARLFNEFWYDFPTSLLGRYVFGFAVPISYISTDADLFTAPRVEEFRQAPETKEEKR